MTNEQMERAIETLLAQNGQFNEALDRVRDIVEHLAVSQAQTTNDMHALTSKVDNLADTATQTTSDVRMLTGKVIDLTDTVMRLEIQGEADRRETGELLNSVIAEMRDSFDKLILANEVTRKLSEDVARLTMQNSQRVTGLERRVGDLEAQQ